ncbi:MAG: hypothetical protein K2X27_24940, partial [Candidatus Obscuribacterales bacterium]|nr:hypothetical protein [Candidatus Obscuribacterales bacterium]
ELRMRQLLPEGFHYFGPGARTLSGLGAKSELDLLKAGQEMLERTPWRGIEEGRFFKLSSPESLKISSRLPGAQTEVIMGRRAANMFHTHESSYLPSSADFNTVYETGIVAVPQKGVLTFYEGSGRQAEALVQMLRKGDSLKAAQAAELLHNQSFKTLIVDPSKELAVGAQLRWNPSANRMQLSSIKTLDYAETVKNLQKWRGQLNIDSIQHSAEALLKPGMTDFLRKISADGIQ